MPARVGHRAFGEKGLKLRTQALVNVADATSTPSLWVRCVCRQPEECNAMLNRSTTVTNPLFVHGWLYLRALKPVTEVLNSYSQRVICYTHARQFERLQTSV